MVIIQIFAILYVLFVMMATALHIAQYRDPRRSVSWGSEFDWMMLVVAYILGPFFILTTSGLAIILVWTAMMIFEGVGALLHLLEGDE